MSDQLILNHYKKVAKYNGLSSRSSMEDPIIRGAETSFILSQIELFAKKKKKLRILEAGCGNGYLLSQIREKFPNFELVGVEFTPELFELAKSRHLKKTTIINADIRKEDFAEGPFDIVITERVIINILSKKQQYIAYRNLLSKLKPLGIYIQVESYNEPLQELNRARREMALEEITQSYQNLYITENSVVWMKDRGIHEIEGVMPKNYLSTHFYITRVLQKVISPAGTPGKYTAFDAFFREALPPAVGNFSQILFRVFKKSKESHV